MNGMTPMDYQYLMFRRTTVFLDEWLSYLVLIYIYYHRSEKKTAVLGLIVACIVTFNLVGYYYLGRLEDKYGIYDK